MKKFLSIISLSILLVGNTSCLKDKEACTPKSLQSESAAISAYATANGINGTTHASGIYYEILNAGTGNFPTASSTITANYVGRFISNNTIFDQSTPATGPIVFNLNGVIAGWQIAIPLAKKGQTIKMIIPSSLAYGCTGRGSIGPDEVLYFEVTLVDVQ
ncbi:MAG: FKBP-type peptidyl-prolyl cis-trans isomerase [Chitinophagaceae bacterium]